MGWGSLWNLPSLASMRALLHPWGLLCSHEAPFPPMGALWPPWGSRGSPRPRSQPPRSCHGSRRGVASLATPLLVDTRVPSASLSLTRGRAPFSFEYGCWSKASRLFNTRARYVLSDRRRRSRGESLLAPLTQVSRSSSLLPLLSRGKVEHDRQAQA